MKKELNDQIKDLVNPSVYNVVDKSTDHYARLGRIQTSMNKIERAGKHLEGNMDIKIMNYLKIILWIMVLHG